MKVFRATVICLAVLLSSGIAYSQKSTTSIQTQEAEIKIDLDKLMTGFESLQELVDQLDQDKRKGEISVAEIEKREAEISTLENKLIVLDNSIAQKKENLKKLKASVQLEEQTKIAVQEQEIEEKPKVAEELSTTKEVETITNDVAENEEIEAADKLRNHRRRSKEVVQLQNKIKLNDRIIHLRKNELKKKKEKMKQLDIGESVSEVSQLVADIKKSKKWLSKIETENKKLKQKLNSLN
jgi:chromosome segregation ATPase